MPLCDHFRPPVEKRHSWDELHGMWQPGWFATFDRASRGIVPIDLTRTSSRAVSWKHG